jgi:hypothetical protein
MCAIVRQKFCGDARQICRKKAREEDVENSRSRLVPNSLRSAPTTSSMTVLLELVQNDFIFCPRFILTKALSSNNLNYRSDLE